MKKTIVSIDFPKYVESDTDDHGHEEFYICDVHFSEGFDGCIRMDDLEDIMAIYNALKQAVN
jgi:hypothetical protein